MTENQAREFRWGMTRRRIALIVLYALAGLVSAVDGILHLVMGQQGAGVIWLTAAAIWGVSIFQSVRITRLPHVRVSDGEIMVQGGPFRRARSCRWDAVESWVPVGEKKVEIRPRGAETMTIFLSEIVPGEREQLIEILQRRVGSEATSARDTITGRRIRKAVEDFFRLGPLPDSSGSDETIGLHQANLQRIKAPVTDEEAALLVRLFSPYACYELARGLLDLIESAPGGCPVTVRLPPEIPLTRGEKVAASHKAVLDVLRLGPLPAESTVSEDTLNMYSEYVARIITPLTDEEAALVVKCFGPDDRFGLAWTLLHLIETAPGGCPVKVQPTLSENEWVRRLWDRSHRTR